MCEEGFEIPQYFYKCMKKIEKKDIFKDFGNEF